MPNETDAAVIEFLKRVRSPSLRAEKGPSFRATKAESDERKRNEPELRRIARGADMSLGAPDISSSVSASTSALTAEPTRSVDENLGELLARFAREDAEKEVYPSQLDPDRPRLVDNSDRFPDQLDPLRPKIGDLDLRTLMAKLAEDEARDKARAAAGPADTLPEDPASQLNPVDKSIRGLVDLFKQAPGVFPFGLVKHGATALDEISTGPNAAAATNLYADVTNPVNKALGVDEIATEKSKPELAGLSLEASPKPAEQPAPVPDPAAGASPQAAPDVASDPDMKAGLEKFASRGGDPAVPARIAAEQKSAMSQLEDIYARLDESVRSQGTAILNEIEAERPAVFSPQNALLMLVFNPELMFQHWQRENMEWNRRRDGARQQLLQLQGRIGVEAGREMGRHQRDAARANKPYAGPVAPDQFRELVETESGVPFDSPPNTPVTQRNVISPGMPEFEAAKQLGYPVGADGNIVIEEKVSLAKFKADLARKYRVPQMGR